MSAVAVTVLRGIGDESLVEAVEAACATCESGSFNCIILTPIETEGDRDEAT